MTELLRLGVAVDTNVLVYAEGEGDAERPRSVGGRKLRIRRFGLN